MGGVHLDPTQRVNESGGPAEVEALRAALASAQRMILEVEEEGRRARDEAERLRKVATPSEGRTPAPAAEAVPNERLVAVLDVDPAWESAARLDSRVALLLPGEDLAARLAALAPARVLVNLAAPGALAAVAELRAAGCGAPVRGCLAAPGSKEALLLGTIEPGHRPIDPEAMAAQLASSPRGTRVLAVGTDADAFIGLQQALTRAGLSVSIAWDGKQAAGLIEIVRPEVVILELDVPPRGGCGLVADLTALAPLPALVLLPPAEDPAPGLAAAFETARRRPQALGRGQLLREVLRRRDAPARAADRGRK